MSAIKRKYLVIGAHPDDCDIRFGGTALKLLKAGHEVYFVSLCNGDCGHFDRTLTNEQIADRRYGETQTVKSISGLTDYRVWKGSHDCELEASVENRKRLVRLIREIRPDVVVSHRTCDYHADHRAAGQLTQDAAYLIGVPMFMKESLATSISPDGSPGVQPPPVFAYLYDAFTDPRPFRADAVVPFDDVADEKCRMLDCHVSQVYEWLAWEAGWKDFHQTRITWEQKRKHLADTFFDRFAARGQIADRLREVYGDAADNISHAEVFEISPYGRRVTREEFQAMFSPATATSTTIVRHTATRCSTSPAEFSKVLKNLITINRLKSLTAAALLSVASTALADKATTGVRIVEDSKPLFEIIAPAGYTNAVKFAVEDLQHWIKEITDAKADILPAPSGTKKHAVYVGRIFAEKLFTDDMKALEGSDGYAIRFKDDNFYLFGPKDRSCIYAASRFIENNTDLIWARPDETFGTVFTKTNTLDIVKYDYVDRPAFPIHGWNVVAIRRDLPTGKWVFRNGGNEAQQTEPKGQRNYFDAMTMAGGHIYWWMAHPDKYFKTHPEYYNYSKMSNKREPNTLCLTAPGLVELAVSNLTFRIKELYGDEGPDTFHIGFRDSMLMCQCDDCLAPIKLKDGTTIECQSLDVGRDCRYYSTRYYTFISQIADELHKVFPRTIFVGSGYLYAAQPPACDIPEYMWVDFCPIGGVDGRYPILSDKQAPVWSARLKEWAARFPGRIYYYEYWCSYGAGHASVAGLGSWRDKMVQDLRDMKHVLKGPGISCELTPDSTRKFSNHTMQSEWDGGTAYRWLCARLMWEPDQDPDALIDYCLNRTYREAAPAMKKFYDAINVHFRNPARPNKGGISFYATKHAKDALAALEEAERSVKHPTSTILIQRLKTIFMECKALSATDSVPMMDKTEHYTEHNATCWDPGTALVQNDFRVPDYFNWGGTSVPRRATELRFLTDGKTLFIRYQADAKDCVRHQNAAGLPNGDYISIRFKFPNRQWRAITLDGASVADSATNRVVHYPGEIADGYVGVIAIPLAELNIDIAAPKTFPGIILDRRCFDGETAEISTLKGRFINQISGKLCF